MFKEVEILSRIDHPNIIRIFETFQNDTNFYIVTEYVNGGELFYEILRRRHFSEKDTSVIMRQVFSVLTYCHSQNIIHRDIKPENILIEYGAGRSDGELVIKIVDFGSSLTFDPIYPKIKIDKKVNLYGTPYYIAPEVIRDEFFGPPCDLWSCGVLIYILLAGEPPFDGTSTNKVLKAVCKKEPPYDLLLWKKVSDECKEVLNNLLDKNPENRMTAVECIKTKWI